MEAKVALYGSRSGLGRSMRELWRQKCSSSCFGWQLQRCQNVQNFPRWTHKTHGFPLIRKEPRTCGTSGEQVLSLQEGDQIHSHWLVTAARHGGLTSQGTVNSCPRRTGPFTPSPRCSGPRSPGCTWLLGLCRKWRWPRPCQLRTSKHQEIGKQV